jgi:hypothetical protein
MFTPEGAFFNFNNKVYQVFEIFQAGLEQFFIFLRRFDREVLPPFSVLKNIFKMEKIFY